jgi:hypothetical protein
LDDAIIIQILAALSKRLKNKVKSLGGFTQMNINWYARVISVNLSNDNNQFAVGNPELAVFIGKLFNVFNSTMVEPLPQA